MLIEVWLAGRDKVLRGSLEAEPFELRVAEILVAVGRTPNTEQLGLDRVGVGVDQAGAIVIDEYHRTNIPSIYATGDVTTHPRYVYVAAVGGAAATQNALGEGDESLDFSALPRIIFTSPALAQAGWTEAQAREQGMEVETRVLALDAIPRALVN